MSDAPGDRLYFRQLLAGRDFATSNPVAAQMVNFCYLIGDRNTRECVVVDPAWDVAGLVELARNEDMEIVGALATHYHPDHVGGDLFGHQVEGVAHLQEIKGVPVHCNRSEARGVKIVTGLSDSDIRQHDGGDVIEVGEVRIELVHTPGHTPGSQCFLVERRLVSGDTLFVQGCGRVDLPGGDPEEMYRTLSQRLANLPDDTVLYPGHHYGPTVTSTLGEQRRENYAFAPKSLDDWLRLMG
jgi:glyoxylase-like metal-dependent hydrolase (beta-lactamase superfamily II)